MTRTDLAYVLLLAVAGAVFVSVITIGFDLGEDATMAVLFTVTAAGGWHVGGLGARADRRERPGPS